MISIAVAFYETPWFRALLIMLAAVIIARVVDAILARRDATMSKLLKRESGSAARTRFFMIRRLAFVSVLFVGIAFALGQFPAVGTLARAMLASVAIVAAVIGIAARAPIANLVSGIMIAFSQPVRLGDYVSVDQAYGTVEEIKLTYTYIRTLDNHLVVIPNEKFASTVVNNYSMGSPGSMIEITFAVPASVDIDATRAAALKVADNVAPPPEGRSNTTDVYELGAQQVTIRVHAWAPEPLERRRIAGDLRAALHHWLLHDGLANAGPDEVRAADDGGD